MNYTANLGLRKPQSSDNMRVQDLNYNFDEIDSAISAVLCRKTSKEVIGGTNACSLSIPTNGCFFVIVSIPGVNMTWVGLVYCSSNGTVTYQQINSSTGISVSGVATNRINFSFTYASTTTLYITYIPFRGDYDISYYS